MHISEGVLSAPVLIGTGAVSALLTYYGFNRMKGDKLPKTALMSSLFFLGSFIHVPLGPSSVHLLLNGLVGAMVGICAFPAIFTALLMQVLLFQFGGFTTLGANLLVMALPALAGRYLFNLGRGKSGTVQNVMFFLAGGVPVMLSSILLSFILALGGEKFGEAAWSLFAMHLPVVAAEGIICVFLFRFILKVYPDIMEEWR